ncbi:MAG: hypothetical protein M0008_04950 [Actinomycetota bacterium]|nr:hypothetical protein [Actinomycetota bacterium]
MFTGRPGFWDARSIGVIVEPGLAESAWFTTKATWPVARCAFDPATKEGVEQAAEEIATSAIASGAARAATTREGGHGRDMHRRESGYPWCARRGCGDKRREVLRRQRVLTAREPSELEELLPPS